MGQVSWSTGENVLEGKSKLLAFFSAAQGIFTFIWLCTKALRRQMMGEQGEQRGQAQQDGDTFKRTSEYKITSEVTSE